MDESVCWFGSPASEGCDPSTMTKVANPLQAKMRLELLNVKADLERELETLVLKCSSCGLDVH